MARCELGYICQVCGEEVEEIFESDLYLSFVIGEMDGKSLFSTPERHIRCNPVQAQFIVDDEFAAVAVEGPFDKRLLDPPTVRDRESLVTRGWRRLQEVRGLNLPISEYPLEELRRRREE
jgi:hypothetical protein